MKIMRPIPCVFLTIVYVVVVPVALLSSTTTTVLVHGAQSRPAKHMQDGKGDELIMDQELLNAMELFMGMSGKEREETIQGLLQAAAAASSGSDGDGGHTNVAEMEALLEMLPAMEEELKNRAMNKNDGNPVIMPSSLQQMIQDDALSRALKDAQNLILHSSKYTDWDSFWADQEIILEATVNSGQLSKEDAAKFQNDPKEWEIVMRSIWADLNLEEGLNDHAKLHNNEL